jgi:DNA-directed RNA polymerase specialized sigma24 family protein
MTTMSISFTPAPFTASPRTASWCFLLLEHLDEFATLAWYLVADGKLVEDTFARTMAKLDMTPFEPSIPALAYSKARNVLITQAVDALVDARREEDENRFFQPNSTSRLPDHPRLAFMLRLIMRSSEAEVAKALRLPTSEVQGLVRHAIDRFSVISHISALTGFYDA